MNTKDIIISIIESYAKLKNIDIKIEEKIIENKNLIQIFTNNIQELQKIIYLVEDMIDIYVFDNNFKIRYLAD